MKKLSIIILSLTLFLASCQHTTKLDPVSDSGVKKAHAKVETGSDGLTNEQRNIKKRVESDNTPGSILHLYGVSPFTGDVVFYSTVDGKVTSSSKRLTSPSRLLNGDRGGTYGDFVMPNIGDDGAYGGSIPYLYWWDVQGNYQQVYPNGLTIIIKDKPMRTNKTILQFDNIEEKDKK
jgi:hypothetical protein